MDISQLKKLSGINTTGSLKAVKTGKTTTSAKTSTYNTDTSNKSATAVRDVDSKSDINQDVSATSDITRPTHEKTKDVEVEDMRMSISVTDSGAPKIDDETEIVKTTADKMAASESVELATTLAQLDETLADCDGDITLESAGDIGRFPKSMGTFKRLYKLSDDDARNIIYALRGGVSKAAAMAMAKIFPRTSIRNKDDLARAATELFDEHPELQAELMEREETAFKAGYRALSEYVKDNRG